jgi:hypothetical protein
MARHSIVKSEIRTAVSEELKRYLTTPGNSITKIARDLKISRQSLYDYRDGTRTPSGEQLAKLLGLRGFSLKIAGKTQKPEDFPRRAPTPQPVQEEFLFKKPVTLESKTRNLRIGVKGTREGDLQLTVLIKLAR